jgi:hypothetical protein
MDTFVYHFVREFYSIHMNIFRPFELSLNEKSFVEIIEGPKAKQYEILASVPCRAGNDYYTLSQVVTHGEQLVKKLDGINVLAGVQQVFISLNFFSSSEILFVV